MPASTTRKRRRAFSTSAVVVAELSFGASASAHKFGALKASLRKRGLAKGDADLQIAATAIVEDAVLVTDDRALLDGMIPDLKADNWIER